MSLIVEENCYRPLPSSPPPYMMTQRHCGCSFAGDVSKPCEGCLRGVLRPEAMEELGESRRAGEAISVRERREGSRVVSSGRAHLLGLGGTISFCTPWAHLRTHFSCSCTLIRDTMPARTRNPVTLRRKARS